MLKWGIIGTGFVAYEIGYAIQSVPRNVIVAVSSGKRKNAERYASVLDVQKIYDTTEELLSDPEINIIYIAIPNILHFEVIKQGLHHGKHILCEKPFTINARQAAEIQILARSKGLFCMEAFWSRFIPSVIKVKELLDKKAIGKVKMISGSFGHVFTQQRGFVKDSGGGVMLDLGFYPVSLAYALLGKPAKAQGCMVTGETGADVQGVVNMIYKDESVANLSFSYRANLENVFTIYGDSGRISLRTPFYRSSTIEFAYHGTPAAIETEPAPVMRRNYFRLPGFLRYAPVIVEQIRRFLPAKTKKLIVPFLGNGYRDQIIHVRDCIDRKLHESPLHPLGATIEVLQILDSVRKSQEYFYPGEERDQI